MIRIKPILALALGAALFAFFISQMRFQLVNGSCMFRYVLPRCDYVSYVRASQEIAGGESPYYPDTNYIYTPLLAIVMIPFSWMNEVEGFTVWTIISTAAFAYGACRAGSSFR
ncbi:MAG: hypothetical protein JXR73_16325 [Candidatus Omnitrophica bacterium]|nr:hypothetical protein [Candidatus Omnitrophota bacterium]